MVIWFPLEFNRVIENVTFPFISSDKTVVDKFSIATIALSLKINFAYQVEFTKHNLTANAETAGNTRS